MKRIQYRLFQLDHMKSELRDSKGERTATIRFAGSRAIVETDDEHFSLGRSGPLAPVLIDGNGTVIARAQLCGVYQLVNQDLPLQWKPLSLWHAVYGWTLPDGTVVIRYVPSTHWSTLECLITVERRIDNELRWIGVGAYLLRLAGSDSVAWISATAAAAIGAI